jgi:nucleotide-binding universal stress UspA family protein
MLSEAMRPKVVVGVDGSVAPDAAVRWAGRLRTDPWARLSPAMRPNEPAVARLSDVVAPGKSTLRRKTPLLPARL